MPEPGRRPSTRPSLARRQPNRRESRFSLLGQNSCNTDYNYYCLSAVILLGDAGVGKTSLWIRFAAEKFSYKVLGTTAAVDFAIRDV